ncbi:UbiA prenyltransferase family-domain-containing protein [Colletotrichum navitas]|uniref:UbiA prenyltransferase family-domain-containing protein n=1 Tax=Colletotrichum navitas TaxID=681940 RepID=A0AAD8VBE8_9PEZI|nr:UbiA prenyltransferase family-domain-containing protein [Colletotrichum navitas]KAK1600214.1 UbiA prenyltransferase family-domain-containing protein [Colletotrichum navitas]
MRFDQVRRQDDAHLHNTLSALPYHLQTLWLFTYSDIRTMLVPILALGTLTAIIGNPLTTTAASALTIFSNLPLLLLWLWLNILVLSIANQRDPSGILEDSMNKPWRPIASGRISATEAKHLLLGIIPLTVVLGIKLDVGYETLACICASSYYNDLGGADEHFLIRQFINGLAYPVYGVAALKLAAGAVDILPTAYTWLTLLGLVVGTTIQIQDLKDYEGDKARERHTFPVVLGDGFTRVSVCMGILFWSFICPAYWNSSVPARAVVFLSGILVTIRILYVREAKADRFSFMMWSWWVMGLFMLPLTSVN